MGAGFTSRALKHHIEAQVDTIQAKGLALIAKESSVLSKHRPLIEEIEISNDLIPRLYKEGETVRAAPSVIETQARIKLRANYRLAN